VAFGKAVFLDGPSNGQTLHLWGYIFPRGHPSVRACRGRLRPVVS
jgi:hypothetical protein